MQVALFVQFKWLKKEIKTLENLGPFLKIPTYFCDVWELKAESIPYLPFAPTTWNENICQCFFPYFQQSVQKQEAPIANRLSTSVGIWNVCLTGDWPLRPGCSCQVTATTGVPRHATLWLQDSVQSSPPPSTTHQSEEAFGAPRRNYLEIR